MPTLLSPDQKQEVSYQHFIQLVQAGKIIGRTLRKKPQPPPYPAGRKEKFVVTVNGIPQSTRPTLTEAARIFFEAEYLSHYLDEDKQFLTKGEDLEIQSALFEQFKISHFDELDSFYGDSGHSIAILAGYCLRCRASDYQLYFCHTAANKYSSSSQARQDLFYQLAGTVLVDNRRLALCLKENSVKENSAEALKRVRSLVSWHRHKGAKHMSDTSSLLLRVLKTWKAAPRNGLKQGYRNLKNWIIQLGYQDPQVKKILPTKDGRWTVVNKVDITHFPCINDIDQQLFEELQLIYHEFRETLSPRPSKCTPLPQHILEASLPDFQKICGRESTLPSTAALLARIDKIVAAIQDATTFEPMEFNSLEKHINQQQIELSGSALIAQDSLLAEYQSIIREGLIVHLDSAIAIAIAQRIESYIATNSRRTWVNPFKEILVYVYRDGLSTEEIALKMNLTKYKVRSRLEEIALAAQVRENMLTLSMADTQKRVGKSAANAHTDLLPGDFDQLCYQFENVLNQDVFDAECKAWYEDVFNSATKTVYDPENGRQGLYADRMRVYISQNIRETNAPKQQLK